MILFTDIRGDTRAIVGYDDQSVINNLISQYDEDKSLVGRSGSEVVQSNSATAEETSATSQELSAQAATMNELVSSFTLK